MGILGSLGGIAGGLIGSYYGGAAGGAAGAGAGSAIGGGLDSMFSQSGQESHAEQNAREQYNEQLYMRGTAYQTAVSDMKSAGLNPMLAYSQGGAPQGAGAQAPAAARPVAGDYLSSAGQVAQIQSAQAGIDNTKADTLMKLSSIPGVAAEARGKVTTADQLEDQLALARFQMQADINLKNVSAQEKDQIVARMKILNPGELGLQKAQYDTLMQALTQNDGSFAAKLALTRAQAILANMDAESKRKLLPGQIAKQESETGLNVQKRQQLDALFPSLRTSAQAGAVLDMYRIPGAQNEATMEQGDVGPYLHYVPHFGTTTHSAAHAMDVMRSMWR